MDCLAWLLYIFVLAPLILAAPPTRKTGSYGKPGGSFDITKDGSFHNGHHQHHFQSKQQQQQQHHHLSGPEDQGWFNGQAAEPPVEWPEEAEDGDDDDQHHDEQNGPQNGPNVEGSAGPWVGLADSAVWPDSKKKPASNSWPSSYGSNGKKNGRNGKARTTAAPTWPPKPIVPQGGWPDPSNVQGDDAVWPDSPAIQLHKKFHGNKNGNGKIRGGADNGVDALSSPKVPSWSDGPVKDGPWSTATRTNGNGNGNGKNGNGKKNGSQQQDGSHHSVSDKPAILGWDQIPTGYAQKRPTWTKKKDHVIKFKESKFSQTDYTAPSDDKAAEGAWVEDDDEETGWVDEGVSPKQSWPTTGAKSNGANGHHAQRGGARLGSPKGNGSGGPGIWRDGSSQSWPRATAAKHVKWSNGHHRSGGDTQGSGAGHHSGPQGHHEHQQQQGPHHASASSGSSLNNGWLDLQKELYLLKNKVRVSSSNTAWPNVGGPKDGATWKQQWSSDQEPSSAATRMVTKVVFAESLPKGEKMVMRWTPPVSYQVSH